MTSTPPGLIDVHTHVMPMMLPELQHSHPWHRWPSVVGLGEGGARIMLGDKVYREIDERCWSVERRIADMDAEGVAMQILSPTPVLLCHDAPSAGAVELTRAVNNSMYEMTSIAPDRFAAFGCVALQDPAAAVTELERCMTELGFVGIEIGTRIGDRELIDPAFDDFFAAAERLDATIFIHPVDDATDPRLARLGLTFGVGMPTETGSVGAAILTSDLLIKHPALRLYLAHGGGTLPGILGRLDWGSELGTPERPRPKNLARQLMCDSLTYDVVGLDLAVERFGSDHVMFGSDYPFLAREHPGRRTIDAVVDSWSQDQIDKVARCNAQSVLGVR